MSPLSPHSQLLRVTSCAKCVWMLLLTVCCWSVGTCSHVSSVAVNWQNALDPRQLEEDEEAWFDEEEETVAPTENLTSSPDMNRLPPITSTTPPTTHASSPFTLPSYSPRPAGALTRLPLMETKMPTISAVSNLVSYPDPLSTLQKGLGMRL